MVNRRGFLKGLVAVVVGAKTVGKLFAEEIKPTIIGTEWKSVDEYEMLVFDKDAYAVTDILDGEFVDISALEKSKPLLKHGEMGYLDEVRFREYGKLPMSTEPLLEGIEGEVLEEYTKRLGEEARKKLDSMSKKELIKYQKEFKVRTGWTIS